MLEIDSVRNVIESRLPYELSDQVSDAYLNIIKLATSRSLTEAQLGRLLRKRQFLEDQRKWVLELLADEESSMWEGSLVEAFTSTVSQVDEIIAGQQG